MNIKIDGLENIDKAIVGGGYITRKEIEYIRSCSYVICADSGCNILYDNNILPNICIGDMDSVEKNVLDFFISNNVQIEKFPRDKDFLDSELCIQKIQKKGMGLFGLQGSRPDQSFASYIYLYKYKDMIPVIFSNNYIIFLLQRELTITNYSTQKIFSIFAPFGNVIIAETKGLQYPLMQTKITQFDAFAVSNESVEREIYIKVEKGYPIIFMEMI